MIETVVQVLRKLDWEIEQIVSELSLLTEQCSDDPEALKAIRTAAEEWTEKLKASSIQYSDPS